MDTASKPRGTSRSGLLRCRSRALLHHPPSSPMRSRPEHANSAKKEPCWKALLYSAPALILNQQQQVVDGQHPLEPVKVSDDLGAAIVKRKHRGRGQPAAHENIDANSSHFSEISKKAPVIIIGMATRSFLSRFAAACAKLTMGSASLR